MLTLGHRPIRRDRIEANTASNGVQHRLNGTQLGNADRLIEAIARALNWKDALRSGQSQDIDAIAIREGRSPRNVRMMLNLAFLAPNLIAVTPDRKLSAALSASIIAQGLPLDWAEQRR